MTQGEVQAFWSGVAATSKGKILVGTGGGSSSVVEVERITEDEIDEILNITIPWAEDSTF